MARALNPLSDIYIRYLLGSERNKDLLMDFINAVFEEKGIPFVEDLEIKNPFNKSDALGGKESVLDIKAKDVTGRIINVEVQLAEEKSFSNRSLYYWSKSYNSQLEKGEKYNKLNPTVCINLLDFVIFPDLYDFHSCFHITEMDNPDYILTKHLQIHFIELRKLSDLKAKDLKDKLLAWCYYLQKEGILKEDQMPVLIKDDDTFKKAHEEYKRFTADDALMNAMEAHEKWLKDYNSQMDSAEKRGLKKGREEERHIIAKKMLKKDIDPEIISQATGLSLEEIGKLS